MLWMQQGLIRHPADNGIPRLKRYLESNPGQVPPALWTDIPPIGAHAKERTGYATQKPLELYERIIKASSKPGDTVLDIFAGCAYDSGSGGTFGPSMGGLRYGLSGLDDAETPFLSERHRHQ